MSDDGSIHKSVETFFIASVPAELPAHKVKCMPMLRVWRQNPDVGLVEIICREPEYLCTYRLNAAGSFLWAAMENHPTLAELVDLFANEYGIEPQVVADDVRDFLNVMIRKEHVRAVLSH